MERERDERGDEEDKSFGNCLELIIAAVFVCGSSCSSVRLFWSFNAKEKSFSLGIERDLEVRDEDESTAVVAAVGVVDVELLFLLLFQSVRVLAVAEEVSVDLLLFVQLLFMVVRLV